MKEEEGAKEIEVDLSLGAVWRDEAMVGANPSNWCNDDVWDGLYDVLDDLVLLVRVKGSP